MTPARTTRSTCIALAAFALAAPYAAAATFRVDDSASLPSESSTPMKWKSLAPGRNAGNLVEGASLITVRLNVAAWQNRNGKIYMTLPPLPLGEVTADWTTQGTLLPGHLVSGNRTLVYAGPLRTKFIEDTIVLKLQADGRRLTSAQRLQFQFEIDIE